MLVGNNPDMVVGAFGAGALAVAAFWRLIVWVRDAPATPDPWDAEVEQKLHEPEAQEVCHHCFEPQPSNAWFCARCGSAVGPYNNWMPYVQIFSEGEVLRNGTSGRFRNRPLILAGYLLISLGMFPLFAPIYLISLLLNLKRPVNGQEPAEEPRIQQ